MLPTNRPPTHPGRILLRQFLEPRKVTQAQLAAKLGVPLQRINGLVNERRSMTPETALMLAREFRNSPEFWMNLQTNYDLWHARQKVTAVANR